MSDKRYRGWKWTLNNYTDEEVAALCEKGDCIGDGKGAVAYLAWGREVAPTTGTPHLQGVVVFKNERKFSGVVKWFANQRISIKHPRPGQTCGDMDAYTKKDCTPDNPHTAYGKPPMANGVRRGFDEAVEAVQGGMRLEQVARDFGSEWVRYNRGLSSLKEMLVGHRVPDKPPFVVWLYGNAGSGKSHTAVRVGELMGDYYIVAPPRATGGTVWFGGYEQNRVLIFDEFRVANLGIPTLLRIMDKYQLMVEGKGTQLKLNSPYIIFTSIQKPSEMFAAFDQNEQVEQIERRIHLQIDMTGKAKDDEVAKSIVNHGELFGENDDYYLREAMVAETEVQDASDEDMSLNQETESQEGEDLMGVDWDTVFN